MFDVCAVPVFFYAASHAFLVLFLLHVLSLILSPDRAFIHLVSRM